MKVTHDAYITYFQLASLAQKHYENMSFQIYRKFYHQKLKMFRFKKNKQTKNKTKKKKKTDIFQTAQNIDCGYSLEPPRRGGSNEYPQSIFLSRNKKSNV